MSETAIDLKTRIFKAIGLVVRDDADSVVMSVKHARHVVEALVNTLILMLSCLPDDLRRKNVDLIVNNLGGCVEEQAEESPAIVHRGQ
jgi:hypothetical protein